MVAKPLLSLLIPELTYFTQPLSGMMAGKKTLLQNIDFQDDYGVDIGILIDMYSQKARIKEVNIGKLENRMQQWQQLGKMSREVARTIIKKAVTLNPTRFNLEDMEIVQLVRGQMENVIEEELQGLQKIAFFDMDDTILQGRFIDTCARLYGFQDKVMNLRLKYQDPMTLAKKIAILLKGFDIAQIITVVDSIPLVSDIVDVVQALKKKGYMARETLLLATWNIREFNDKRSDESLYYIAEIIDAYDFIAVQEVSSDLKGLERLMGYLGKHWNYIVTDSTEGSAGGGERMAFLYDTHKISFRNIACEIVLPPDKPMTDGTIQFARTPFLAAFQAGWFKFTICTVHIYYGETSINSEGMRRRIAEIEYISKFLQKKAKNENSNYIILGDFNIEGVEHETFRALESGGFYIPEVLKDKPTDLGQVKHYDQIAFKVKDEDMLIFSKSKGNAGAFKFQEVVMREEDLEIYKPYFDPKYVIGKTDKQIKNYYENKWRTFQMSDHLPMWVELNIDFSDEYLRNLLKE